jgi:peptide/nickel transport system permease protein
MKWHKGLTGYGIALILIITLNFVLPRLLPGDPLLAIYGEEALLTMSVEQQVLLRERLGLDAPLLNQYVLYWRNLFQGDLGYSYYYKAPVTEVLLGALPWSLLLVGTSLFLSTWLGLVLGLESGWRRGKAFDGVLLTGIVLLGGIPDFFLGMLLLIYFGVTLQLFPLSGSITLYSSLSGFPLVLDILWHLVLPVVSLTLVRLSGIYLVARNSMIGTMTEPFVFTAKAKGLSGRGIRYKHAGKHVLLPVITQLGVGLGRLATGSLFIEMVFSYPGLGLILQKGLEARDYPLLTGTAIVIASGVLLGSLLVEIIYGRIDPRLKHAH